MEQQNHYHEQKVELNTVQHLRIIRCVFMKKMLTSSDNAVRIILFTKMLKTVKELRPDAPNLFVYWHNISLALEKNQSRVIPCQLNQWLPGDHLQCCPNNS